MQVWRAEVLRGAQGKGPACDIPLMATYSGVDLILRTGRRSIQSLREGNCINRQPLPPLLGGENLAEVKGQRELDRAPLPL